MKALALLLLAFSAPAHAANFCTVDSMGNGPMCPCFDVQSCQQAARYRGGVCVHNTQPAYQPPPPPTYLAPQRDAFGDAIRNSQQMTQTINNGFEAGRRRKMEQERRQAEMRLLEAQRAAVEAQPNHPEPPRTDTFAHVNRQPGAQPQTQT